MPLQVRIKNKSACIQEKAAGYIILQFNSRRSYVSKGTSELHTKCHLSTAGDEKIFRMKSEI